MYIVAILISALGSMPFNIFLSMVEILLLCHHKNNVAVRWLHFIKFTDWY
jgi:hypothetical protein